VLAAVPFHTLSSFSLFLISELQEDLQMLDCALEVHADRRDVDMLAIARHAVGTLLARGHSRIALIRPQADADDCDLTGRGVREGFSTACRSADASLNVFQLPNIPKAIHATLDSVVTAPDRPTALVFAWTKPVLKVTSYLAQRGIRIPQDVSLFSMGQLPYLDEPTFPTTCVGDPGSRHRAGV
jgi:DNA-binding LacI/PurR family transcriptional regulator